MPKPKTLSPFAEAALQLDTEFNELERLHLQLNGLDVESEFGLEQAKKILQKFSESGTRASAGVQALAKNLNESRERAERAAHAVAERAQLVEQFYTKQQSLLTQFQLLGDAVRTVTDGVGQLRKADTKQLSAEERAEISKHLPELNSKLSVLIDQSRVLKTDAQLAKLKTLEKNAHALGQTLASAQSKLGAFLR